MSIKNWNWAVWMRGVVAAAISGAATGVTAMIAVPEAVSLEKYPALLKVTLIGALVGLAGYLKQSPLPKDEIVITEETKVTVKQ